MASVHIGDTNISLRLKFIDSAQSAIDISGYTTLTILLQDESGTTSELSASFVTDGSDGLIAYSSTASTFSTSGTYRIQGKVSDGTTTIRSNVATFQVLPNLD